MKIRNINNYKKTVNQNVSTRIYIKNKSFDHYKLYSKDNK
jgi:hypothetical protein